MLHKYMYRYLTLRTNLARMNVGTGAEKTMHRASGTGIRVTAARQSMQQREEVRPCTRISSRLLASPGSGE